ncbi:TonB-dependent siderophore receptor [Nitrospira sp. KM1]|uniref:TonB-dependent siderophore receptor n=1 Tax=Nitrospira sp. KM1 TaxID=1936990 RepID=UPI0013A74F22|nr:TonB-dependent receptor [Nitrospira sp. KM1]BCA57160.1 TonB-dependent siderophore receptor [Nitrospira sp. KM1]
MPQRSQKSVRNTTPSPAAWARLRAAIAAATETASGYDRRRFAWGFLVSLSALSLTTYQPALSQDAIPEDWKQTPREPENSSTSQRSFGTPRGPLDAKSRNTAAPKVKLAANEQPVGGPKQSFDIPAGDLDNALIEFSRQSGVQVVSASTAVAGLASQGLRGEYTIEEALHRLLAGTGLQYRFSNPSSITLHSAAPSGSAVLPDNQSKPIKVSEVVVKDVREPAWTDSVDGYKADNASTVTRSTMPIEETPVSIGVVTRDLIRDTFSRTQGDAFEAVSGVTRDQVNGARSEGFNIRGFTACSPAGNFNGMKVNGLPTDCLFAPDWGIVERYEIVKGPASIVGGAANPGGIVNRITKTPQRANFANVEANAGSYGFYRGLFDVNGVLPAHEDIRGRLVFAVEEGGNFVDFTPVRQYTVAPSVEFDLFKGAGKLLLLGTYQQFNGADYLGWPLTTDGKMLNVPRTRNFGGGAPNGAHTNFTGYNGEVHYNHTFIHDIKLSANGKYSRSKLLENSLYTYTYPGIPPSGDAYLYNRFRDIKMDTYAGELYLSKESTLFGQKHEILAGVDYRDMTRNSFLTHPQLGIDNVFNPRNDTRALSDDELRSLVGSPLLTTLKQTGVFGQAVIRPHERVTLVLAGRHDEARSSITDEGIPTTERTDSAWTGRGGVTVKVTDWMNVYGGIQQSFAPNSLSFTRDNQLLPPETGINYEVGAKLNLFDNRLLFTTALFRSYRRNVSTRDPGDPQFSIAVGEQRHQGVEFDLNGQPIPGLNLNANFMYLDAVITEANDPGFVGSYPSSIPRNYVGRVFATYQLQSGLLQGFGFGGGVYYQGRYELTFPNSISTDPYQRVDAVLFYRRDKRYDVSVNIRNLLNATYIESPGFPGGINAFGAPITAIATVRIFF